MINKDNIRAYINFLFQNKNGTPAPEEVITSWERIDEAHLLQHLQHLYQHWHLSNHEINSLENTFVKSQKASALNDVSINNNAIAAPKPSSNIPNTQPSAISDEQQGKRNNYAFWAFLIGVLLAIVVFYWLVITPNKQTKDNTAIVPNTTNSNLLPAPNTSSNSTIVTQQTTPSLPEQTANDKANAKTIYRLLEAEQHQNFDIIYSTLSSTLEAYMGIDYPTEDSLRYLYEGIWNERANIQYDNVVIEKIDSNSYDVTCTYRYRHLIQNTEKSQKLKTRFVFDADNKIVRSHKVGK